MSYLSRITFSIFIPLCLPCVLFAQVGEHRNVWSIGVGGGINLNTVNFLPKVTQNSYQGMSGGMMVRYTCEKYFSTICSVQAEVNYSQLGWNEDIQDLNGNPVPLSSSDNTKQTYKRTLNYVQVPFMAHLAWGKEKSGFNFFFNGGPQFGFLLSEKTDANIAYRTDANGNRVVDTSGRASSVCAQDTMSVENSFDYGITAGIGVEASIKHVGHFLIEGRYYYGLGNIFGDTKRDYFACSNHNTISIRLSYLFDF